MNPQVRESWRQALLSGKYTQTKHRLARKVGDQTHYCCLGVLCELALQAGVSLTKEELSSGFSYGGERTRLPPEVRTWSGLNYGLPWSKNKASLSTLNDNGWNFAAIAEMLP